MIILNSYPTQEEVVTIPSIPRKMEDSSLLSILPHPVEHLHASEKVLWSGKPEAIPFIAPDVASISLTLGGLVFLMSWSTSLRDVLALLVNPPIDLILGMSPFIAGLSFLIAGLIRGFRGCNNTEYMITDQRLITHSDSGKTSFAEIENIQNIYIEVDQVDSFCGTGTMFVWTSDGTPMCYALQSLKEPNEVRRLLQEAVEKAVRRNQPIRHCLSCGADIDEYAYFCHECGAYIVQ